METNLYIKPGLRIRAFYLFFIITGIQTGVGIMGAPRYIYKEAKGDAWLSILLAGVAMHLVIIAMIFILSKYKNADILGIQIDIFGKWIGKLLGTVYLVYIFFTLLSVLITYIEVIQVFLFPMISPWLMGSLLLMLVVYAALGGLRVVVGVTFIFFFLAFWLVPFLYKPASLMDFAHFQPPLVASPREIFMGSFATSYSFLGLEVLFFIYPFIENKKQIHWPVHLGVAFSTFLVFLVTVISIGYFSGDQLLQMIWPVLALYKILQYTIIERFDFLVVTEWMMVILPTMLLLTWMLIYGAKRLYKVSQRKVLYIIASLLLLGCGFINQHFSIIALTDTIAKIGFWITFVYPFILLPIVLVKKELEKKKGGSS